MRDVDLGCLTRIAGCNGREDRKPHQRQNNADPRVGEDVSTACNPDDVVSIRLHNVEEQHVEQRRTVTQQQLQHHLPSLLYLTRRHNRSVRVQHPGQTTKDADKRRGTDASQGTSLIQPSHDRTMISINPPSASYVFPQYSSSMGATTRRSCCSGSQRQQQR